MAGLSLMLSIARFCHVFSGVSIERLLISLENTAITNLQTNALGIPVSRKRSTVEKSQNYIILISNHISNNPISYIHFDICYNITLKFNRFWTDKRMAVTVTRTSKDQGTRKGPSSPSQMRLPEEIAHQLEMRSLNDIKSVKS